MRKEKLEELHGYIEELKTKRKELVKKSNGFINVLHYDCELNNGMVIPREKVVKGEKDGSAAIVLPITHEGNTILVVQPRVFTKKGVCVELPAGYIEDNEKPELAARRELEEETGYVPNEMKLLSSYYQDQGCSAAYNYSFLALGCKRIKEQNLDKDEFIHYFECQYDEALELMDKGYITDLQSQFTLEKAKSYIK